EGAVFAGGIGGIGVGARYLVAGSVGCGVLGVRRRRVARVVEALGRGALPRVRAQERGQGRIYRLGILVDARQLIVLVRVEQLKLTAVDIRALYGDEMDRLGRRDVEGDRPVTTRNVRDTLGDGRRSGAHVGPPDRVASSRIGSPSASD